MVYFAYALHAVYMILVIILKTLLIVSNGTTLTIGFCFKTKSSLDFAIVSKKKLDPAG